MRVGKYEVSEKSSGAGTAITFLMIGAIDYVFTQFLLATNPELSQVR